jgi:hypothetical protein
MFWLSFWVREGYLDVVDADSVEVVFVVEVVYAVTQTLVLFV